MNRENYFFDVENQPVKDKALVLIVYDIVDNKKRTKLAKLLNGYGTRVQKSAFEAYLDKAQYNQLVKELPAYCSEEDSIRTYKIIGRGQIRSWGYNVQSIQDDVVVI